MPTPISPEAGTRTPEKPEVGAIIPRVVFEESITKKHRSIFKSIDPERQRKIIFLSDSSLVKPQPGQEYNVRIVEDTDPENPMMGKYIVDIELSPEEIDAMEFTAPLEEETNKPISVKRNSVRVMGISLDRRAEAGPRVPQAERFEDFSVDKFSLELLTVIAKSAALDLPLLLEGEAATGKSYTIEYLASLCNQEVYRMSMNGQTDTTDLIGKWVPRTEGVRKQIEKLLKEPDSCRSAEAKKLIILKTRIAPAAEGEEINPAIEEPLIGLTKEEMEQIAAWEGIEVPEGEWMWQNGDIPKQMKEGAWSVLDEVNTCEPQILVRLNALLEKGGQLVLSEDGSRVVPRDPNFRLFATVNPPGGRYKGRVPLSAEWISRWNYQNVGDLPKEIRARRLKLKMGRELPELDVENDTDLQGKPYHLMKAEPVGAGQELTDFYEEAWIDNLCNSFADLITKVAIMAEKEEIGKDQKQKFAYDQRDDDRFVAYLERFHEPGRMREVIAEAIEYLIVNKCRLAADRNKVRDQLRLITIPEPKEKKK